MKVSGLLSIVKIFDDGSVMKEFQEYRESHTLQSAQHKIFGILHKPKLGPSKKPAVLLIHGLGGNKCGKFRLFVRLAELLSETGIITFRVDLSGSGDSEGHLQDMSLEDLRRDVKVSVDFLKNHPDVDASRIGICGRSFGGLLSLLAASDGEFAKAIVLWAPVFDAKPWLDPSRRKPENPLHLRKENGSGFFFLGEPLHKEFVRQFSALEVNKALRKLDSVPLLHIQGKSDEIIEEYHKKCYEEIRRDAHAETKWIDLPYSDHDFSHKDEQEILLLNSLEWLKKIV